MNLELHTDRLVLRPLGLDDLELGIDMFTDPDVSRYVGGHVTAEEIKREMPKYIRRCGGGCIGIWCVTNKDSNEKLGTAILLPLPIEQDDTDWNLLKGPDIPDGDIEIGYVLKKSAWGKGYAKEAAERLLRFAFEDTPLQEIVATIDDENEKSRNILKKIGLREIGTQLAYGDEDCPYFRINR